KLHVRDQIVTRGQVIEEVYFPLSCIISTVAHCASHETVEVATIGNEGMEGLPVFLGNSSTATLESFVQVPGDSLSMPSRAFQTHLAREKTLGTIMGHYTQALLTQISQASACNRIHAAEERCARWLLMSHDRVHRDEFELTQEFLAQMLGVRRATVSE